ncbi:hypothetical protein BCR41DRAFT_356821 [Lobosporangium transversale]|uniref:Uncharacterized protein n=1 Tax=Lobosporangium transversale TaxID=64571 RepID=A0A1Y2GIB3_9FUNG|nr:hypothetical protein BCR41DRAFT_356821 [Lobosporangium transversale]ORZ11721.1 hypothetical protein BCR41DRAFT_356821 [Lobosporangium transversale]|eukprot:XP_021879818.1 hypothetical protein BCR41DRAFT_356821 [Lobosporangium transversale]
MSDIEFFLRENKKVKKYSDFPTPPVDILWANEDTKQLLERILPLNNLPRLQWVLIQALFCDIGGDRMVRGYQDKVSLQSQDKDLTRFKLKGTISTNGLVLNLLAYDTTQTKRQQHPSQELELSQGFLNTTCSKAAGEDLTDEDYANINWKRSSKLLENVELTFNKPGRCPSANTTTIVGCDPGIVNALTFSSLDLTTLTCGKRKREKGMIEVESAIPVFGRDTYNEYFQWMNEESQTQTGSTNLDVLQEFYESRWHLKKKWDLRKAQRATFDYAVQRVLKMLGDKGVLVVGLGSFESSKGVPSKHTAITRHLVTQVKARGHFAVGAHEFYTSARCPRPLCDSFLETVYPRSKYCGHTREPAKYKPTEESPAPAAKRARR